MTCNNNVNTWYSCSGFQRELFTTFIGQIWHIDEVIHTITCSSTGRKKQCECETGSNYGSSAQLTLQKGDFMEKWNALHYYWNKQKYHWMEEFVGWKTIVQKQQVHDTVIGIQQLHQNMISVEQVSPTTRTCKKPVWEMLNSIRDSLSNLDNSHNSDDCEGKKHHTEDSELAKPCTGDNPSWVLVNVSKIAESGQSVCGERWGGLPDCLMANWEMWQTLSVSEICSMERLKWRFLQLICCKHGMLQSHIPWGHVRTLYWLRIVSTEYRKHPKGVHNNEVHKWCLVSRTNSYTTAESFSCLTCNQICH